MSAKIQQDAPILANHLLQGSYFLLDLDCAPIARLVQPGQFVHVQLPRMTDRILRRPFSVFDIEPVSGRLSIVYKVVGRGTDHLARLSAGDVLNLIGPLGTGFSLPPPSITPLIVAGGYGCAATYLLAKHSCTAPLCLFGGRTSEELLLIEEYRELGAQIKLATDDGSLGHHGMVTELLEKALREQNSDQIKVYACGPDGMLKAVSEIVAKYDLTAEISLDHAMCCGVGACFACVVKMKTAHEPGWEYVRTCRDGPVFRSDQVVWE